jgi:membrane protein required for colicin V production
MNWADWAIVAVFCVSILISLLRGLVRELLSLLVWLAALIVAMSFYESLAPLLVSFIDTASMRLLTAWLGLFAVVLLIGGLINYSLGKLIKASGLSGTDRFLGVFFGAARGAIVVLAILIILPGLVPVDQDAWWRESLLISEILRFENWARATTTAVIEFLKRWF